MLTDWFCKKCALQFDKKYVFDLHLSLVHGKKIEVKKEPMICEENLQEHQVSKDLSDHEVDNCLKCNICDSSFKSKQNLKKHTTSVHEGKKPFKCNVCNASFAQKAHLKKHVA